MARRVAAVLVAALSARVTVAARAPNPNIIGTDLLVRTATTCDMPAAWRLLNHSRFSKEWLMLVGTGGETPLMASVRSACAEHVALLMLHPDFDDKTIRKLKYRKAMVDHAINITGGVDRRVKWALVVMHCILVGKVSQGEVELDPRMAETDLAWFLPKPGEWMPPMTLAEMGIEEPVRPSWDLTDIGKDLDGVKNIAMKFEDLWSLLVRYLQSAEGSEERLLAASHIRSIGWSLFFAGSRGALLGHANMIAQVSQGELVNRPSDDDELHRHMRASLLDIDSQYRLMSRTLGSLWNKTGDWVIY